MHNPDSICRTFILLNINSGCGKDDSKVDVGPNANDVAVILEKLSDCRCFRIIELCERL